MVVLADLLAVPELSLAEIAVGAPGVDVRWVATSELTDPTPYLQGGEVLLTTGLETAGWRTQWREYVDRLVRVDVAALGLGVGLTHRRTPAALVRACRDAGLNLFEVPRPTPFVSVSQAVAALLDEEGDRVARRSLDAQRALTRAALERDDVPALLRVLAEQVGGGAATVSREGELLVHAGRLDAGSVRHEVLRIRDQGLRTAASASGQDGTAIVQPLGVRNRPEVWLAVWLPGRPSEVHRAAVATAASLLGLSLERRHDQRTGDRRLRTRGIELLMDGDLRTAQVLLEATVPRQVRVLCARGPAEAIAEGLAAAEHARVLAGESEAGLTVLCPQRRATAVSRLLVERGLLVGIGRAVQIELASDSRDTAREALASATPATPARRWDERASGGVAGLLSPELARTFARSYLAPLGDDPALADTLAAYLMRHGSVLATAEDLAVHRNTVRNRIRQIESLLDVSLDDPQVRVDAWVALQAR